jgi:hypothetical protein
MRINHVLAAPAHLRISFPAVVLGALLADAIPGGGRGGPGDAGPRPATRPSDAQLSPYASDPNHLWNRLHRALFVRASPDGRQRVHTTDPLLYRGGIFLLEGEPHRRAVALLDQFLAESADRLIDDPLKRLFFQRDLWAAFDYMAWYPDDWVHHSRYEPAAIALRSLLARMVSRLALSNREINALPDNYAMAVKSKQYAADHDPKHPQRPFLPADLFDPAGPWVRFHETTAQPMARQHLEGAGGRAVHIILLRLPGGRAATERYLKDLGGDSVKQFPSGTMVAMVRRALVVDRSAKVRVTPVAELVQIRVYRQIPEDPRAHSRRGVRPEEQDAYEFVLDRGMLFAGRHGLRSVGPDDLEEPFGRSEGDDPFERGARRSDGPAQAQLKSCIQCHPAPGIHSVTSVQRGLRQGHAEVFRTYAWDVEMNYTVGFKVQRFNWGLLQGLLEARREGGAARGAQPGTRQQENP